MFSQSSLPSGGSSLFGASSTAEQPTKRRGLFDSIDPSTTQATNGSPAPATGGLFAMGAATSQPTTSGPSLFPTTTSASNQTSQAAGGSSIFGGDRTVNINPNQSQSGQPFLSQSTREPAYFNSLLERGRKRAHPSDGSPQLGRLGQMPGLHLGLDDIARKAQEIGARSGRGTPVNGADSKAHYLLAASGISPGKALKDFESIEREMVPKKPGEVFDPDNEKYIRGLQQRGRDAIIKESMDRVHREFDAFLEDHLAINFDEQRQRIMEHFGLVSKDPAANESFGSPAGGGSFGRSSKKKNIFAESAAGSTRSVFGRSGLEKSIIGTPGMDASTTKFFADDTNVSGGLSPTRGQDRSDWDKQSYFADKVMNLNVARLQEQSYPILQEFLYVEQNARGDAPCQLAQAYEALMEVVRESPNSELKERRYAPAYLDEQTNSVVAVSLRKNILDGSRVYLEKAFYREVESLVEKHPREAQLGGRPTVTNKVRAYIRVRSARKDLAPDGAELQQMGDDGDYCWILIFFLLRCGFVKEAAAYVNEDPAFQSTDKRFVAYMTAYANSVDRRLSRKLQEMINGEYQQRMRIAPDNSIDPYRMACYEIVGRCDLRNRRIEGIAQSVEDWIWLQFNLARELDRTEEVAGDIFGLEQICETVREIGQRHFQRGSEGTGGYETYFMMQILAGMYEHAVQYLHSYAATSAVHFAIALDYYGLLRVADFAVAGNELLTTTTRGLPQINFVPLITFYTSSWRTASCIAAVDYLTLLCLNSDISNLSESYISYCHESLRQLCLETREFAKLLGDIRSDGTRIQGAIEQRSKIIKIENRQDFLQAVTRQAAQIADERGQVADAALLYHLSEDFDNVVDVISRSLADAISVDLDDTPMTLQPLKPRQDIDSETVQSDSAVSSLSLTTADSPYKLAHNMINLYNGNAAYYSLIREPNRRTCGTLMQMMEIKHIITSSPPQWMLALDKMNDLGILPLMAGGNHAAIRTAVSSFSSLPEITKRATRSIIVWSITCIAMEREQLMQAQYATAEREAIKGQLAAMANDLVEFAGQIKFRLGVDVYGMLARIAGEAGYY